ncbi:MAG: hypothetical protein H7249_10225 [Chitinophagaceae bacterium]|nr:hypothetical protein [Oligoflexus sp.]
MKTLTTVILSATLMSPVVRAEMVSGKINNAIQSAETDLYNILEKDMTIVNFAKGGSVLSEAEARNIRAVYRSVVADGDIEKIIVAAWSDKEAIKSGEKLPEAQVVLAQKRAEAVKRSLSEMTNKPIESYNMGQDAGWIAKTFRTKDARLKDALKSAAAPDRNTQELASLLELKGGPGTALVIVKRDVKGENSTTGR